MEISLNLAGLASTSFGLGSTQNTGRQSAFINSTDKKIRVFVKVKLGDNPSGDRRVFVHLLRKYGTLATDNASDTEGNLRVLNAERIGELKTGSDPSSGDVLCGGFLVEYPGTFAVHISHNTEVPLHNDGHSVSYIVLE